MPIRGGLAVPLHPLASLCGTPSPVYRCSLFGWSCEPEFGDSVFSSEATVCPLFVCLAVWADVRAPTCPVPFLFFFFWCVATVGGALSAVVRTPGWFRETDFEDPLHSLGPRCDPAQLSCLFLVTQAQSTESLSAAGLSLAEKSGGRACIFYQFTEFLLQRFSWPIRDSRFPWFDAAGGRQRDISIRSSISLCLGVGSWSKASRVVTMVLLCSPGSCAARTASTLFQDTRVDLTRHSNSSDCQPCAFLVHLFRSMGVLTAWVCSRLVLPLEGAYCGLETLHNHRLAMCLRVSPHRGQIRVASQFC